MRSKKNRETKKRYRKRQEKKRNYAKTGCIVWALGRLWRLDRNFVFFVFASVPVAVILPLAGSYFTKTLIDSIGAGTTFSEIIPTIFGFIFAFILLDQMKSYIESEVQGRQFYPTFVYQNEMGAMEHYQTDYENNETQDFQKVKGYAWNDACYGNCALEFLWKDLSDAFIHITGIVTYASLLFVLNPVMLLVVTIVSVASYFTTRWQSVYYEKKQTEVGKGDSEKGLSAGTFRGFFPGKGYQTVRP